MVGVLTAFVASAAGLQIDDGGHLGAVTVPVHISPPPPSIPAACKGPEWDGATVVYLANPASLQNPYHAGNGKNIIFGTPGSDVIYGGNSKDCILGLGGNDTLVGGNGDDYIDGGPDTDQCDGGSGTNTIVNCEPSDPPKCDGEHHSDDDKCKKEGEDKSGSPSSSVSSLTTTAPAPVAPAPPAAPSGLSAIADGSAVKLTWSSVEGVASYNIYRSDTHGSGYVGIGSATTPAFTDADVKLGTTYYYVVTAVGPTKAQSSDSNEATVTPLPTQSADKPGRRTVPVQAPVGISVSGGH